MVGKLSNTAMQEIAGALAIVLSIELYLHGETLQWRNGSA